MPLDIKLDHAGMAAMLKSGPVAAAIGQVAEETATNIRSLGIKVGDRDGSAREIDLPVTVTPYTSDRAAASVALAHPSGEAVQAKHGALTKGAAAAGLEVNG